MTDGGGSSGCSTCVGIFKTLLNRSTFIEVHKLLKSGRSGEQYPFTLVDERLNFVPICGLDKTLPGTRCIEEFGNDNRSIDSMQRTIA